jgi:hypothetical protein
VQKLDQFPVLAATPPESATNLDRNGRNNVGCRENDPRRGNPGVEFPIRQQDLAVTVLAAPAVEEE